jgi:hypothetical protein
MSDRGAFRHQARVTKWTAEQTAAAAEHYGISSDELTHEQLMDMDFEPDEEIEVDHEAGTVTHTDREGRKRTLHIEEWNAEHLDG